MNRPFTIALGLTAVLFAGLAPPTHAQGWALRLGPATDSSAHGVGVCSDGGIAVVGELTSTTGDADALIARFDASGRRLWRAVDGGPGHQRYLDVVELGDGSFAVAGRSGAMAAYVIRDASGTPVLERTGDPVDLAPTSGASSVALSPAGDALFGGYLRSCDPGCHDGPRTSAITFRLGSDGTFGGGHYMSPFASGAGSEFTFDVLDVTATAAGGQIAGGWHFGSPDIPDAFAVRVDASGALVWHLHETVGGATGTFSSRLTGVGELTDGTSVLAGSKVRSSSGEEVAWLLAVDPVGVVLWERELDASASSRFEALAVTPADEILAAGTLVDDGGFGGSDAWLVRVSPAGDVLSQRVFGGARDDSLADVGVLPSGGVALAGTTRSFGPHADAWVFTLDTSGRTCVPSRVTAVPGVASASSFTGGFQAGILAGFFFQDLVLEEAGPIREEPACLPEATRLPTAPGTPVGTVTPP